MDVGAGQPDATVVDGQHRLMSPAQGGGPDRIGSLFDGARPTAATPDTGFTERLLRARNRSVTPVWTWERATGRWRCRRPARVDVPVQGGCPDRIGSLFATVLARLPQRRIPGGPNAYHEPVDVTSAQRILTLW